MLTFDRNSPRRRGSALAIVVLLLVCGVFGGGVYWFLQLRKDAGVDTSQLLTSQVTLGPFDHIVSEQGEIESSKNIELECMVESRGGGGTSILWVVDEGTKVKEGDKLVELDSSQLEQELKTQRIVLLNARARVTTAEALVKQAEITKEEYLLGTFKTEEKAIESEMAIAAQNLKKAQLALQSAERMVAKGTYKSLQKEADEFAVVNAQNQLDAAETRLTVLRDLTKEKFLVQYDSEIESARALLEAEKSTLEEEELKMEEIKEQIGACVMYAPSDGVVVHANRYSSRGGSAEFVVEAGASVRERQTIIRLPDPSQMQVKAKINESRISLVSAGMPCTINVSSLTDVQLMGRVTKVNRYAEPSSFFTSSIKEYACTVEIIDPPESIRTGMTAEVQIFVQQLPEVMQIPIQGVYEHGGRTFTLVKDPAGKYVTKEITIKATNDQMAAVSDGLNEGEEVVVNLRQHLNLMTGLPEISVGDNVGLAETVAEKTGKPTGSNVPSPVSEDGPSGAGRRPGGPGSPGGTGPPTPAAVVQRVFESSDNDNDGVLSASEIGLMDSRRMGMAKAADKDGDGKVTRQEMTSEITKRFASGGGGGGRPGGG